jgi:hypothetical protein
VFSSDVPRSLKHTAFSLDATALEVITQLKEGNAFGR